MSKIKSRPIEQKDKLNRLGLSITTVAQLLDEDYDHLYGILIGRFKGKPELMQRLDKLISDYSKILQEETNNE